MDDLQGARILVTGGGRRLGAAIAPTSPSTAQRCA